MTNPITDEYGNQKWRNANGHFHREDGPAVIWADGSQVWYLNDKCHRSDGPAAIFADGTYRWYVNGRQMFSNKQLQKAAKLTDEEMTLSILKYGNVK